jgi:hypothetical protein
MVRRKARAKQTFDVGQYLSTSGVKKKLVPYSRAQTIFSQGDTSDSVLYLQLSATS